LSCLHQIHRVVGEVLEPADVAQRHRYHQAQIGGDDPLQGSPAATLQGCGGLVALHPFLHDRAEVNFLLGC